MGQQFRRQSNAISIHALRGEGDVKDAGKKLGLSDISIHALRGEGDAVHRRAAGSVFISIHALRGEGDWVVRLILLNIGAFQSTPSVGRATMVFCIISLAMVFQSTPSVGRATPHRSSFIDKNNHFNPRPPWGGRH